jgi:ABC-type transport system involved in multi-copper enzyme maturation permease subunit
VRLLLAELRKLRRPLTFLTAAALIALIGLIYWGGIHNQSQQYRSEAQAGFGVVPPCADLGVPPGQECDRQQAQIKESFCRGNGIPAGSECDRFVAEQQQAARQGLEDLRRRLAAQRLDSKTVAGPIGAGTVAAGMMASLFGCVAIFLMAGGHMGNEWSGRTIKAVLTQEGRRWRVLAGKVASLWLLGVALMVVLWIALAIVAWVLSAVYPIPGPGPSAADAFAKSLPVFARALLVLLAFAALGALAAVVTRNTLGSFFLAFAVVIASLILAGFKASARFTPAYWVTGWMGFGDNGTIPNNVWRNSFYPVKYPSHTVGLIGLVAMLAVCATLAWLRVERSDIKV